MTSIIKVDQIQNAAGVGGLSIDSSGFVAPKTIMFSATNSASQSMAGSYADYKIQMDTEDFDLGGYYDTSNYRFTPLVEGYYYVTAGVSLTGTQTIQARIYKNGAIHRIGSAIGTGAFGYNPATVTNIVYLNGSTDYVELYAVSSSGGVSTATGGAQSYFQAMLVGGV